MVDIEAYIWHDKAGKIIAVGHVPKSAKVSVEPMAQEGHAVIRARLSKRDVAELHLTHRVDCERGELAEIKQAK